jgi:GTP-binding protein Era
MRLPNSCNWCLLFLAAADAPQDALAMFQPGPDWNGPPMAVLLNKADQLEEQQLQELTAWYKQNCRAEQVGQTLVKLRSKYSQT